MLQDDKDFDWLFKNYESFFEKFGMDRDNIISVYYEWKEDDSDTIAKYLGAIFEKLLHETYKHVARPAAKFEILSLILNNMRSFKINYEGVTANDIYKKYLYCQLKMLQLTNLPFTVTVIAVGCCPYCAALNGKKFSIEEALESQFLPPARCINDVGCNCYYRPEMIRNETAQHPEC
jgi:hypothetical protein